MPLLGIIILVLWIMFTGSMGLGWMDVIVGLICLGLITNR